jgi:hypothetical protein
MTQQARCARCEGGTLLGDAKPQQGCVLRCGCHPFELLPLSIVKGLVNSGQATAIAAVCTPGCCLAGVCVK